MIFIDNYVFENLKFSWHIGIKEWNKIIYFFFLLDFNFKQFFI